MTRLTGLSRNVHKILDTTLGGKDRCGVANGRRTAKMADYGTESYEGDGKRIVKAGCCHHYRSTNKHYR